MFKFLDQSHQLIDPSTGEGYWQWKSRINLCLSSLKITLIDPSTGEVYIYIYIGIENLVLPCVQVPQKSYQLFILLVRHTGIVNLVLSYVQVP